MFNIANYVFTALAPSDAAMALDVQPPEQLLRMRAQAETLAKQDRLFARKDPNWVDWPTVQQGRIKCLAAWNASQGKPHAEKMKLLREVLVMLFFSVQPPDRVGIIRRLRFGMSVKANGDGFDLDLSNMRFKNSKFYGVRERRVERDATAARASEPQCVRLSHCSRPSQASRRSSRPFSSSTCRCSSSRRRTTTIRTSLRPRGTLAAR